MWNQFIFIWSRFEACSVQRFHLQKVCARDQFCILPRMKKFMALFHIEIFLCHVTLANLTSTWESQVALMWVISGLLCGSVGQMGQLVWPTFNPAITAPPTHPFSVIGLIVNEVNDSFRVATWHNYNYDINKCNNYNCDGLSKNPPCSQQNWIQIYCHSLQTHSISIHPQCIKC